MRALAEAQAEDGGEDPPDEAEDEEEPQDLEELNLPMEVRTG